jgi:hypothetical protein
MRSYKGGEGRGGEGRGGEGRKEKERILSKYGLHETLQGRGGKEEGRKGDRERERERERERGRGREGEGERVGGSGLQEILPED